ncbi:MAG: Rrf2 family transcriptional regulator [Verrucomicrobiota bacterium]
MKLSVKLEYACRVLVCLAKRHGAGEILRIEEMALEEEVPANYLAQILSDLRKGGMVLSKRGKQGGYLLARAPEEVSLWDVVLLVEGEAFGGAVQIAGASGQTVSEAWGRLRKGFEEMAKGVTLRQLVDSSVKEQMYYI